MTFSQGFTRVTVSIGDSSKVSWVSYISWKAWYCFNTVLTFRSVDLLKHYSEVWFGTHRSHNPNIQLWFTTVSTGGVPAASRHCEDSPFLSARVICNDWIVVFDTTASIYYTHMCKRKYTLSLIIIIIIIGFGCEDQYILSYNLNPGIQSVIKY